MALSKALSLSKYECASIRMESLRVTPLLLLRYPSECIQHGVRSFPYGHVIWALMHVSS
jgi:hypothetical protein